MLAFFAAAWIALLSILIFAPDVYVNAMKAPASLRLLAEVGLFTFVSALIAILVVGVLRRWRWAFWLIVVAFAAGLLRVPASILQLTGTLPAPQPTWYVLLQAVIGVVQFAIAIALLIGYRKSGTWGAF